MHYAGQSYELPIRLPPGPLGDSAVRDLEEAFGQEHERTYGHRVVNRAEIVNLRIVCRAPRPSARVVARPADGVPDRVPGRRLAYFGARFGPRETAILRREHLSASPTPGPIVVEEYDATIVVPPDWAAALDRHGNVILQPREG
jgi:N-methylhydantoinase A